MKIDNEILKILKDNSSSCSGIVDVIYSDDFDKVKDELKALFINKVVTIEEDKIVKS